MGIRDQILGTARAAGQDFAGYDRQDDEDLSQRQLELAIRSGEITIAEIAASFGATVREVLALPD